MNIFHGLNSFIEYINIKNYSKNTLCRYKREIRDFLIFTKKEDVREISIADIDNYRKNIFDAGKYQTSSQNGILKTLKLFFKYLSMNEYILINPFDKMDLKIQKHEKARESISEENLKIFLDSIEGESFFDLRDRALFELIYGSGLRAGEVCGLNITDIDFNSGKIFLRKTKGNKERFVPIGEKVLIALKKYLEYGRSFITKLLDSESFFVTYQGRKMNVNNIGYMLKKRFAKIFPNVKICPHMLRHSFATHMLEAGAGIKQIKEILGHKSIETTSIYTHFNISSMKKILKMYHPRENELYEEIDKNLLEKLDEIW